MRETIKRIRTEEVPAAIERASGRVATNEPIDVAATTFREAAKAVIENPRLEANHGAREAYRLAQAEPDQWNAAMRRVLSNDEMKGLYRSAATRAERDVTLRTPGAVSLPDLRVVDARNPPPFQAWQYMRQELDARAAAAKAANDHNTARQMASLSDMLDGAIREVNPHYVAAQAINAPGQQITSRLRDGVLGGVVKTKPDISSHELLSKAFSTGNTTPTAIAEMRQAFVNAGQEDALNSAFSAYVRSVADKASKTLAGGDVGNVPGKVYAELFGDQTKRDAVAAVLGGRNTTAFRQFADTMRALEITSMIPHVGSVTATDLNRVGAAATPAANAGSSALKLLGGLISPHNWGTYLSQAGDALTANSASNAARETAARYQLGPAANRAALDTVRLMSPTVTGLLELAGRGAVGGGAGLLRGAMPPADWQPYQPPPRR
jgi:hypothetical protein